MSNWISIVVDKLYNLIIYYIINTNGGIIDKKKMNWVQILNSNHELED